MGVAVTIYFVSSKWVILLSLLSVLIIPEKLDVPDCTQYLMRMSRVENVHVSLLRISFLLSLLHNCWWRVSSRLSNHWLSYKTVSNLMLYSLVITEDFAFHFIMYNVLFMLSIHICWCLFCCCEWHCISSEHKTLLLLLLLLLLLELLLLLLIVTAYHCHIAEEQRHLAQLALQLPILIHLSVTTLKMVNVWSQWFVSFCCLVLWGSICRSR